MERQELDSVRSYPILFLATFSVWSYTAWSQSPSGANPSRIAPDSSSRARTIDLTKGEPVLGLPAATVLGYPEVCSEDGYTYLSVYADASGPGVAPFPRIYSVSEQRDVKQLKVPVPSDYKQISLRSLFPGTNNIVYLIGASQPKSLDSHEPLNRRHFYISQTDRDGGQEKLTEVNLKFEPMKIAVLDTGKFLIVGADTANMQPVVALLREDGSLERIVDLGSNPYASPEILGGAFSPNPGDSNSFSKQRFLVGALGRAQLVPWGKEVLLVQPGSNMPIYRFSGSGLKATTVANAPKGYSLQTVLASTGEDNWIVAFRNTSAFQALTGGKVVENAVDLLFEIDPSTGKSLTQINVNGPLVSEVSCAAHRKLSALYYKEHQKEAMPDGIVYASAPR